MNRLVLPLALLFAPAASAQIDIAEFDLRVHQVEGQIFAITGANGNIGVLAGRKGTVLVTDRIAPIDEKIRAALKKAAPAGVQFIIATHWHGRGGGGVVVDPGVTVIAHENVKRRILEVEAAGRAVEPASVGFPLITFEKSIRLRLEGEEVEVLHAPRGHTDGDSVVYFPKSRVAHLGGLFYHGRFPEIDLDAGGTIRGLLEDVEHLLEVLPKETRIIPYRGKVTDIEHLREYHRMLAGTTRFVKERIDEGRTLAEIQKEGLPPEFRDWGNPLEASLWIATVHRSLLEDTPPPAEPRPDSPEEP